MVGLLHRVGIRFGTVWALHRVRVNVCVAGLNVVFLTWNIWFRRGLPVPWGILWMAIRGVALNIVRSPLGLGAVIWTERVERLVMNVVIAAALRTWL